MAKGLGHLIHREQSKGFRAWQELVAERASMAKGLGHMLHREQSKGWRAWLGMIEDRAAAMELMQRSVGYMLNRKLASALASWQAYLQGAFSDDPMAKALRHMMNRELSRGWVRWFALWVTQLCNSASSFGSHPRTPSLRRSPSTTPPCSGTDWRWPPRSPARR